MQLLFIQTGRYPRVYAPPPPHLSSRFRGCRLKILSVQRRSGTAHCASYASHVADTPGSSRRWYRSCNLCSDRKLSYYLGLHILRSTKNHTSSCVFASLVSATSRSEQQKKLQYSRTCTLRRKLVASACTCNTGGSILVEYVRELSMPRYRS